VLGRGECKTQRGGNPVIEASKAEEKDVEVTTATLDRVGPQPGVQALCWFSLKWREGALR